MAKAHLIEAVSMCGFARNCWTKNLNPFILGRSTPAFCLAYLWDVTLMTQVWVKLTSVIFTGRKKLDKVFWFLRTNE